MYSCVSRSLSLTLQLSSVIVFLAVSLSYGQAPPWGKALSFGGSGADVGSRVKVDRRSNKYVVGSFSGKATFGAKTLTSAGADDGFIMKFRSDGTVGWIVQIAGPDHDQAFDIAFDGDENVYVAGTFTGNSKFGSVHGASKTV